MKKIIFILLIAVTMGSCRVNNGDIGDFFGSWLLYSMTVDGNEAPGFNPEETFWEFQNNIIEISRVDERFDKSGRWGTWSETDSDLLLDFTHSDDKYAPGTDIYQAPEWLYMPANEVIVLHFTERKATRMKLGWTDREGRLISYALRKLW